MMLRMIQNKLVRQFPPIITRLSTFQPTRTNVLKKVQLTSTKNQRSFHTSKHLLLDNDDWLKNDPDIKNFLSDINSDFQVKKEKTNTKLPLKEAEEMDDKQPKKEESSEKDNPPKTEDKTISQLLSEIYGSSDSGAMSSIGGYKEYRDEDSDVIYDIDEEREMQRKAWQEGKSLDSDQSPKKTAPEGKYSHLAGRRGERGVWEVEELVEVLREEKVEDLVVIRIPPEKKYADFMVIGTSKSSRHIKVTSAMVVSLFKKKMLSSDPVPHREGIQDSKSGWVAMDMGNIVLHLFTQEERELYDLEMLWTVGAEYDEVTRAMKEDKEQNSLDLLEQLMISHNSQQ